MSDEEFNRHKKALADLKLEKPKRLSGRSDKIWNEIYRWETCLKKVGSAHAKIPNWLFWGLFVPFCETYLLTYIKPNFDLKLLWIISFNLFHIFLFSQRYNFDRVAIEVSDLELLTREDVLEFYDKFIASGAPERRKLAVHVTSTLETDEETSGNVIILISRNFIFANILISRNFF